jgi:hypothetical protein
LLGQCGFQLALHRSERRLLHLKQAVGVTEDVTIVLQTSGGVRLVNFGHPVLDVDPTGNVAFDVICIDNCFKLTPGQDHVIKWITGKGSGGADELKPPPMEDPNWTRLLSGGRGLEVQLVALSDLEPGELVSHRSPTHSIDVTADADGRALVPVFVPLDDNNAELSLERFNRRSLAGKFRVKATSFVRRAAVERGLHERLEAGRDGGATLTRTLVDGIYREVISAEGIRLAVGKIPGHQRRVVFQSQLITSLQPQPLPPKGDAVAGLDGVADVIPIPGFESELVSMARMRDGSAVVLSVDSSGRSRVAGRFSGPIGRLTADGGWGLAQTADHSYVFKVGRS